MKTKMKLNSISVNSFVTGMGKDAQTVKGGAKTFEGNFTFCCNTDINQGCLSDDRHTQCCD
ncbi:MAG: pinensin family lanthipeptide [Cyclobacteriaceae bacterium]